MSYGHPIPSGHGRRIPAYRWSPTVLPPSQRRPKRPRYPRYSAAVPRCRFPASGRRASAYRASRGRVCRAMPDREPSLWKLLDNGLLSIAEGAVKILAEDPPAGRRITRSFENFLSFLIVLAVMASSAVGFMLGCLYFFIAYADDFAAAPGGGHGEDAGRSDAGIRGDGSGEDKGRHGESNRERDGKGPTTMTALEESWAGAEPMTMAALEVAVREWLGLCWMRRAGRRA